MIAYVFSGAGLLAAVFLAAFAAPAAAQYSDYGHGGDGQTVRCDSNDSRYRECQADTRYGVSLIRQYSKSPCIEGRTWGSQRGAVWVSGGCRAEFAVGRGGGGGGWNGEGSGGDSVRCDSNDNRYRQCPIDGRRVYLQRQYSKSPCIEGRTWGYQRGFVWVSGGCRAQFSSRNSGGGGGWDHGQGGGWDQAQTLYCGSEDRRQRRCNVSIRRDARLIRQASKAPCIEGQSWGWDRNGIWVVNGCRGDFRVN
ncbi:DUF3011 domain-containing protein [Lysobacter cavernae]|uniref:DUF3011 domain-containing protein n=1 Tax=Lysobacter cavernae TaxID=1685901 RepID=A0ABV7RLQ2_9GAMM